MVRKLELNTFIQDNSRIHIADLVLNKNMHTSIHTHDFYEFFIVIKGEFYEIHNENKSFIKCKNFHLIKPNDSHHFVGSSDCDKNILRNIAIEKKYFISLIEKSGLEECSEIYNNFSFDDFIFEIFKNKSEKILSYSDSIYIDRNYIFESLFSDILIEIVSKLNDKNNAPSWLKKAYEEMEKKENFVIGISRFMELSGKTQEHLTREMKKNYNITPSHYINNLRLLESSKLLMQTNQNIIEIIFDCGFNNIPYFNKLFKSKYNITPSQYRQKSKDFF